MEAVLRRALELAKPSREEEERAKLVAEEVCELLRKEGAEVEVGGSIGKGTWIKGSKEIDIFMLFDREKGISALCEEVCRKCFERVQRIPASRDYVKIDYKGYEIEVVPVLKIDKPSEAKNQMDFSPFHAEYVRKKVESKPSLADQIRLLKLFCKASDCYGAESYIRGFSGYATELLMIHYKSFDRLVEEGDSLIPVIFIDIEKHYEDMRAALLSLSEPKTKSPILLIDPICPARNAAAALSYHRFSKFLLSLRLFKRKPSISFFKEKRKMREEIVRLAKLRGNEARVVEFRIKGPKHVFLSKLERALRAAKSRFAEEGCEVYDFGLFESNGKAIAFLEIAKERKVKRQIGPPVWIASEHFDRFINKWNRSRSKVYGPYAWGNVVAFDVKRKELGLREELEKRMK